MSSKRIKASERRKQFLKYINEGKVDEGYYVIDKVKDKDGEALRSIQIRRCKVKPSTCDVEVQTEA